MAGAPMKAIQELMGHADMKTTMRYAHLTPSTLQDVISLLDPGDRARSEKFGQQAVNAYRGITKDESAIEAPTAHPAMAVLA